MSDAARARGLVEQARQTHAPAPWLVPAGAVCLAVGVLGFVTGLFVAPQWAWGSFLANFLFWAGLCQASVVAAAVFTVARARWGRVFQRMGMGLAAFLPLTPLPLLVIRVGRCHLIAAICRGTNDPWLRGGALLSRDLAVLLILGGLSLWFVYLSIRPDLGAGDRAPDTRFGRWATRGWRGEEAERARSDRLMHRLAPAVIIGYAFGYSLLAIDLSMALDPTFRSTMYPGIYWLGQFYAALAALAILAAAWRRRAGLDGLISPRQSQDLGNLIWGFSIFWAYVSWAQYAVIWYGNLPDEALYVATRYRTQPWDALSWLALALTFLAPFLLLFSRPLKRSLPALAVIAAAGLAGILLQRVLDVLPFIPRIRTVAHALVALAVTAGFTGLVALPYLWLMRRVPLFPVTDPLFLEAVAVGRMEE